jgi:glycosyltransferase involved in cell wall biosynthesis
MPTGVPPQDWPVTTYVSQCPPAADGAASRRINLYPAGSAGQALRRFLARYGRLGQGNIAGRFLARAIRTWKPDIIQAIGIRYAAYFTHHVRTAFGVGHIGRFVVQDWGPDLTMDRLLEEYRPRIRAILQACDGYLSDNAYNLDVAVSLGLRSDRLAPAGPVLASGGIDAAVLGRSAAVGPSRRERIVLWPKAYNCPQAVAYPVFEAFKLCWDRIQPCALRLTAVCQEEVRLWFAALPEAIRARSVLEGRIDRRTFLGALGQSRVMLAPTMSDGMPNVLPEAMAMGAVPIVSPLPSITAHFGEENTLFARNLYPHEIADALVTAMTDDDRAEAMARANVRRLASGLFDRAATRERMLAYYRDLAGACGVRRTRAPAV